MTTSEKINGIIGAVTGLIFLLFLPVSISASSFHAELQIENNNIATFVEEISDFNRLRFEGFFAIEDGIPLSATLIIDNNSSYIRPGGSFDNEVDVYRAILEYQRETLSIFLGKQRVPLGVGRIWNPIDIFNPIDITSVEPEEREGTDSIRLEYYPSSLSASDLTLAEDQIAGRVKGFFNSFDLAVVGIYDDDEALAILGWEIEGELWQGGVELRSEGGFFFDTSDNDLRMETIIGVEYGFPNSITLLGEYYLNEEDNGDSIALQLTAQLSPLFSASLLTIISIDDHSTLIAPLVQYSLSDEMSLDVGVFFYSSRLGDGDVYSGEDLAYINWFIQF